MPASLDLITFDTPSPRGAATFWCAALHLVVSLDEDDGRWLVLSDTAGVRRIGLQQGSVRPGSVHLDLECSLAEFDAEVARLQQLGARLAAPPRDEPYGRIVNLADPVGTPFDLCAYL
jgi:predicted enzyme related to lactoylglutathione lyase